MTTPSNKPPWVPARTFSLQDAKNYMAKSMAPLTPTGTNQPPLTFEQRRAYTEAFMPWGKTKSHHSFSRVLATKHGITAAILLNYLAFRTSKSTKIHEERQWHYETVQELAGRYPYLSASAIHETLTRLNGKVLMRNRFNRRRNDKTTWYAFIDPEVMALARTNLLYFDIAHAEQFGLHEAILLHNIQHWVKTNRARKPFYRYHPMSPVDLADILPMSRSSITRALANLVAKGALEKNPQPDGRVPEYALVDALDPCPIPPSTDPSGIKTTDLQTGNTQGKTESL